MAEEQYEDVVLRDLRAHLQTAKIPVENLSTLAKQGDDQVRNCYLLDCNERKIIVYQERTNPVFFQLIFSTLRNWNQLSLWLTASTLQEAFRLNPRTVA